MTLYYTYEIADSKGTFYVGSGKYGRMYDHERQTIAKMNYNAAHKVKKALTRKEQRIASALLRGEELIYTKVFESPDEKEVRADEARRIREYPYLLNIAGRVPVTWVDKGKKVMKWDKGYKRAL